MRVRPLLPAILELWISLIPTFADSGNMEDQDGMAYRLHRSSRSVPLLELLRPQVRQ